MLHLNFNPFPELFTPRLMLRRIDKEDRYSFFNLRSNKKAIEFIDRPLAKTVEDADELIRRINESLKNNDGITWAIALKDERKLIGTIGYWRILKEHFRAEIGYMLLPDFQRKGIMQEAISEILKYGFKTMKLHSIEANVNPANTASMKLLEKNNFIREGYFKESFYHNGKFLDSTIYSLLTTEK